MTKDEPLLLSVVVPAYNEEGRISQTLRAIDQFFSVKGFDYEIIVVDDGSRDQTPAVVTSLKIDRLRLVNYGQNRGKGFAVNYGVKQAEGAWILFTDADNSTAIEQFDQLFQAASEYRVIIGSRYLPASHITVRQGIPRIILGRLGNLLVQALILPGIKDSQCGFKLFEASQAKEIFRLQTIWRWGFDMEILRIAKERGLKIKELPIIWRNDDQSKIQSSRVFISTLGELFRIKLNSLLGRYRPAH